MMTMGHLLFPIMTTAEIDDGLAPFEFGQMEIMADPGKSVD
jgi:hypothetical protein